MAFLRITSNIHPNIVAQMKLSWQRHIDLGAHLMESNSQVR